MLGRVSTAATACSAALSPCVDLAVGVEVEDQLVVGRGGLLIVGDDALRRSCVPGVVEQHEDLRRRALAASTLGLGRVGLQVVLPRLGRLLEIAAGVGGDRTLAGLLVDG